MAFERRSKYSNTANKRQETADLDINFDLVALTYMARYAVSMNSSVYRSHLMAMDNLFNTIKEENYSKDPERYKRYKFIKKALEARLAYNITERDLIFKYTAGSIIDNTMIDVNELTELTTDEVKYITNEVSNALKYSFIYRDADNLLETLTKFKSGDFASKAEIIKGIESNVNDIQNKFRKNRAEDSTADMSFSLREGQFETSIAQYHTQLSNPSNKLLSGMQGLNEMINGGFESGRVYMFLGLPGDGKSVTLLNLAYQLKEYNRHYKCKDLTKTPCVVLLTMENSVRETVERLFSMTTFQESMTDYTVEETIKLLREDGKLTLNNVSPIDIVIKYKADHSVDTSYMYTMCEDLEDDGYEVICILQDYIKRIRSIENTGDLRLELGCIVNEFKAFATVKDIPVITASQLNRDAACKVDEAKTNNKNDLIRLLGRNNVGESMLMIENLDWGGIIATEYDSSGNKYIGMQTIKKRFKTTRDYIYQPFCKNSTIRIEEDLNDICPAFKDTLYEKIQLNVEKNIKYSVYNTDNNFIDLDEHDSIDDIFKGNVISSSTAKELPPAEVIKPEALSPIYITDDGNVIESAQTSKELIHIPMSLKSTIIIKDKDFEETFISPIQYVDYDHAFEDNLWKKERIVG